MKTINNPPKSQWPALCERPQIELDFLEGSIKNIINRVRKSGDEALRELTLQFDKVQIDVIQVSDQEVSEALTSIPSALKTSILAAAKNIEVFHAAQRRASEKIETMPGVTCWRKATAIQKVGIYIPGGSAPLFSTVLMLGVPARLAGCEEVILCSPPDRNGKINPAILFAAQLTGVKKIYKVGGAQAIAAMAFGTETIPNVSKIFGPGNQYVTKAKQLISQEGIAIDMPAGPSEVLIFADNTATPAFLAADLLAQAEHGGDSQVILVTESEKIVQDTLAEIEKQLATLPRKTIAKQAFGHSKAIVVENTISAFEFINAYAPEHLIIASDHADKYIPLIRNAGSVFLGNYCPESAGDYASGTNHTLPTNGWARSYSGVNLDAFCKKITFQSITEDGLKGLAKTIITMAEAEELQAHANAVKVRLNQL